MKNFIKGFVSATVIIIIAISLSFPSLMVIEYKSNYDVKTTAEKIAQSAISKGWVVSGTKQLDASIKKNGGEVVAETILVELCQAHHASAILKMDTWRKLSVMMPCTISVYKNDKGATIVGAMNASILGKLMGGKVGKIFGTDVANDQKQIIMNALK